MSNPNPVTNTTPPVRPHRYHVRMDLLPEWASTVVAAIAGMAQNAPNTPWEVAPGRTQNSDTGEPLYTLSEMRERSRTAVTRICAALAPFPDADRAFRQCLYDLFGSDPAGPAPVV